MKASDFFGLFRDFFVNEIRRNPAELPRGVFSNVLTILLVFEIARRNPAESGGKRKSPEKVEKVKISIFDEISVFYEFA